MNAGQVDSWLDREKYSFSCFNAQMPQGISALPLRSPDAQVHLGFDLVPMPKCTGATIFGLGVPTPLPHTYASIYRCTDGGQRAPASTCLELSWPRRMIHDHEYDDHYHPANCHFGSSRIGQYLAKYFSPPTHNLGGGASAPLGILVPTTSPPSPPGGFFRRMGTQFHPPPPGGHQVGLSKSPL